MLRLVLAPVLVLLLSAATPAQPPKDKKGPGEKAKGPPKGEKKVPTTRELFRWLEEPLDMKPFQNRVNFKEVLGLFSEAFAAKGKELPLFVDEKAFWSENPDAEDLYESPMKFPRLPRRMAFKEALHLALAQLPSESVTFLVRKGVIEITTADRASPEALLKTKVRVIFDKRPLADALEELSDLTGFPILLDPRLGEKGRTPVSARFGNGVSLDTAVRLLSEMAGVRARFEDDMVFITETLQGAAKKQGEIRFRNRPVDKALRELAERTGANIVLDSRVGAMGSGMGMMGMPGMGIMGMGGGTGLSGGGCWEVRVSATIPAKTSPRTAAKLLAVMAGLEAVFLDGIIFVTTSEVAAKMGRRPPRQPAPRDPSGKKQGQEAELEGCPPERSAPKSAPLK
jgi:hypothetical protein